MFKVRNRKHQFDEKHVDKYYRNDKYLTAFWNTLSQLFPEGEKFFVDAVRASAGNRPSPETRAFIGQEAMHSREHIAFNKAIGVPGEKQVGYILNIARKLPLSIQLEITCSLEHYTSIMAEQLLTNKRHNCSIWYDFDKIWSWHAVEECEHNKVAFSLSKSSYLTRVSVFTITTLIFILVANLWYWHMLIRKGLVNPFKIVKAYLELGWLFKDLVPSFISYYNPWFRPKDVDEKVLSHFRRTYALEI